LNSIKINSKRRANSYLYTEESETRGGWEELQKRVAGQYEGLVNKR